LQIRQPTSPQLVSNDLGAIALQEFIDLHGLRVPEDVSLLGFDNVSLSGLARMRIDGDRPGRLTVPVQLVVHGSTGPPGGG
jgi:hypothetical protein